jgi:pimeloyl-ACP methyl ester carboxylesterase
MVHRLMAGFGAAGVDRVVMMPAGSGLSQSLQRHLSGRTGHPATQRLPELEVLEMALREDARASADAVLAMAERQVAAIVVLGGDGTHRGVQEALSTVAAAMYPSGRQTAVLTGELDRLSVPVLVVWGEQDRVLPAAHAEALAGRARVERLAGAGHSPHMEAANEVNRLVGAFLDEQDPP